MTRRERMERRLGRRLDWAAGRDQKAVSADRQVRAITDHIPLGQPILVGHHSERHARRDQARIEGGMQRMVESMHMAEHHRNKADGIRQQLDRSIFSDDPDACERIEDRIASLEAKREQRKAINKTFRIGGIEAVRAEYGDEVATHAARDLALCPWGKVPFPPYSITNLGANIRRLKERLVFIDRQTKKIESAEQAGGLLIIEHGESCSVTFSEKPEREVINALKAARFFWSGGSWHGSTKQLPQVVLDMQPDNHEESREVAALNSTGAGTVA